MKLHMVGLPHTQTTKEQTVCAFTQKLVKFCEMMLPLGHEIYVYSGEHNEAPCEEHVQLFSDEEQNEWYPDLGQNVLPRTASWEPDDKCWRIMNGRAVAEIMQRADRYDFLLLLGGKAQKPIADALPSMLACEWAVGYEGMFSERCCFESEAWKHYIYGRLNLGEGRWFDTVIPNFFRPADFDAPEEPTKNYLLYVGQLFHKKGIMVAADIAREVGFPIIFAGSGVEKYEESYIKTSDGCEIKGDVEYVGTVNAQERNDLMGNAIALLAPTLYIEPFGAVAVEAQLCGTPVITTDWGAFTETVHPRFRFKTLEEGVDCVVSAGLVDRSSLREAALRKWSLDAIAPKYDDWLTRLVLLYGDGWYGHTKSMVLGG